MLSQLVERRARRGKDAMKTELENVSSVLKKVRVEVPASDVDGIFDKLVREQRKRVALPGFRPGKAPLELVRGKLAGQLDREATDEIVRTFGDGAVKEHGLKPIPGGIFLDLDEGQEELPPAKEGQPYNFALAIEVLEDFEPKGYEQVPVTRPAVEVAGEEVDRELQTLRESRAKVEHVSGRASKDGDLVSVDIEAVERDGSHTIPREERTVRLGAKGNLPEFERGLVGLEPGQTFSFDVTYPAEYAAEELRGKTMTFRGTVKDLHEVALPELDDAIAQEVAGVETVAELRERVQSFLAHRKEHEAERAARRAMMEHILEQNPFEVPRSLVESELQRRLEALGQRFAAQGIDPDKIQVDWDRVITEERERARGAVREAMLLDRIAAKESLDVTAEEVDAAIAVIAEENDTKPHEVRAKLVSNNGMPGLRRQLLRSKCVDWLYGRAHIA